MKSMRVAILSDLFVTKEVLQRALDKAFSDSGITFEYSYWEDRWPATPVQKNDEISEFVGNDDEVVPHVAEAEMILTHTAPITAKVITAAPRLKIVGAARGGPTNINWTACTERGIPVLYAPGRNSAAVAEFAIGLMLAQSRNITRSHMSLFGQRKWRGDLYVHTAIGKELGSSIVGVIGLGAIGKKIARLACAFGAKILVYDPYQNAQETQGLGYEPVALDELLRLSDFISLSARLTKETAGMIAEREIGLMKRSAYLVNTARGELIQQAHLYRALKENRIAGAALDVFEDEPPPGDSPLFALDNVTATSHLAGASIQAAELGAKILLEDVHDYLMRNTTPRHCVNPEFSRHARGGR